MSNKISLSWLENFLEEGCENLRGNMDGAEYKQRSQFQLVGSI